MKLRHVLISDPKKDLTLHIANQCTRLADKLLTANLAKDVLRLTEQHQPELILVSLDFPGTPAVKFIPKLIAAVPQALILATYRELSVPVMEKIQGLGVNDFVPHPVNVLDIFRAASRRFNVPFRRHDRYSLELDVLRADGIALGKTTDISEGGMCLTTDLKLNVNDSILVDIRLLPKDKPLRLRCLVLNINPNKSPPTANLQFARIFEPEQLRLASFFKSQQFATQAI